MGMLDNMQLRWNEGSQKILQLQATASSRAGLLTALSKTLRLLFQLLILGLGAYLSIQQEISPALMIAGSILLSHALAAIDLMIGSWKGFILARAQYVRLNSQLHLVPEDNQKMALPEPTGSLQAEQLVFVPPGSKTPVLKGVSFSINAGDSVGIIGPSGAGKSSLLRGLLGIWPTTNGKIRLDGADVFEWDRMTMGPHLGYLPQDIELFDGTISENIARFDEVDAGKVVASAQMAEVHDMILRFPEGYDTLIGASGGNLSGWQRICLARALYGHPKVVVVDEPNSNLDDQGELALAQAIKRFKANWVTVLIVTHWHALMGLMGNILILKNGLVALYGPREQVVMQQTVSA